MLKLTEEQQDEFYKLAGLCGATKACAKFGEKYGIPSILLEGHLRRVKRLSKYTHPTGFDTDHLPPKASVADEQRTLHIAQKADRSLARDNPRPYKHIPPTHFTDLISAPALVWFCRQYQRDPDAGLKRVALLAAMPLVRHFISELVECVRVAASEHARIHTDMPKQFYVINRAFVERLLRMRGDPLRVSQEAADALEGVPLELVGKRSRSQNTPALCKRFRPNDKRPA